MKEKKTNMIIKSTIIILALLSLMALGILSCTRSEGRDIGSKIWGNARSVNPPSELGLNDAFLSIDDWNIYAVTKRDGYFSISGIPDQNYEVSLWKFGHILYKGPLSVIRGSEGRGVMDSVTRYGEAQIVFEFPQGKIGDRSLAGTVLDDDMAPVKDAEITIVYQADGYFHVNRTDHAGSFFFINELKPDPDLMMIDAKGFKPAVFDHDQIAEFMLNGIDGAQTILIPIEWDIVDEDSPKGSISGFIYDRSGLALTGIKTVIYKKTENTKPVESIARVINTNDIGVYAFEFIPTGEYVIWAGHPNYFPIELEVKIENGSAIIKDIVLEESTNTLLHPFLRPQHTN